jgi:hypothetical protein
MQIFIYIYIYIFNFFWILVAVKGGGDDAEEKVNGDIN